MSPNGRYVVIKSAATNLVPEDANGSDEYYLKDTKTGTVKKISVAHGGGEANAAIESKDRAGVSANGRYVVFSSSASNLVAQDANNGSDVFLRDLKTGTTSRVSVGLAGTPNSGGGFAPSISDNGRRVAFESASADLVADDTNNNRDIFVRDLKGLTTKRISVSSDGVQSEPPPPNPGVPNSNLKYNYEAVISGNGKAVAFSSYSGNLVPNDTNNGSDVFLHTLKTGITQRVSLVTGGGQAPTYRTDGSSSPSISANGQIVAFISVGNLANDPPRFGQPDSYVHNVKTQVTTRVEAPVANTFSRSGASSPSISRSGRYVSFTSRDADIVAGDTNGAYDVFVLDRKTGGYRLASVDSAGVQGNDASRSGYVANGGKLVSFTSSATNLVSNDTNGVSDVFVHRF
jgi:dipeptidyl aminopeptidase/acylaminoacyl peptidase